MPAETLTHSSIQREDRSIRVYLIPKSDLHPVIYHLDQNNVFENVAQFMGYTSTDMIVSFILITFLYLTDFQLIYVVFFVYRNRI